ncbi:MAG: response regulator [Deltaproteobacteria bacterium]|jgi:FixJ family two-component response regulator/GGDEF domain-containing protein|nr:response regulator [Deltaproteobacteria bacterium]
MPKGRILAVDDQRYFRELLEGMLTEAGFEVQTAASAEEALQVLERSTFDILLTDLVMPQMDGNELVHRVKQRNPDQDVVVVTGVVDVKAAVDAMKLGAAEYLLKPFDSDTLASTLEGVLQSRRLRNEHTKLLNENIEYLDERSLIQRATALFGFLTVEPLAERIIDGLCVETGAQGGVLWVGSNPDGDALELVCARGLVRVEGEQERVALEDLPRELADSTAMSAVLHWGDREGGDREALYIALRDESRIVGLIRLTDKLGGEDFDPVDRSCAEKFSEFAQTALCNALRYGALERKSVEDGATGATDFEFFYNSVRNEIEKSNRHGRCFSVLKVEIGPLDGLRAQFGDVAFRQWVGKAVAQLTRLQRSSDLLSVDGQGRFLVLLPETDALGAAMFKRRAFDELQASDVLAILGPGSRAKIHVAAASYPSDGTQLESLLRLLDERIESDGSSLVREWVVEDKPIAACLGTLLEGGAEERCETVSQIVEFVLAEPARRSGVRSVLFAAPGEILGEAFASGVTALRGRVGKTAISVLGEPPKSAVERDEDASDTSAVRWVSKRELAGLPPFLIYFGEGSAYAMICEEAPGRDRTRFFHTCDRNLVEHLALRAQHELHGSEID